MPPQGRRNRDWSGTTEPLPTNGLTVEQVAERQRRKEEARRRIAAGRLRPPVVVCEPRLGKRGVKRDAAGSVLVAVIPPRIPMPPVEPWHAEVPPWFESPEAYRAALEAAAANVKPPWHHAPPPGDGWAPPTRPATTQLSLGFEMTPSGDDPR